MPLQAGPTERPPLLTATHRHFPGRPVNPDLREDPEPPTHPGVHKRKGHPQKGRSLFNRKARKDRRRRKDPDLHQEPQAQGRLNRLRVAKVSEDLQSRGRFGRVRTAKVLKDLQPRGRFGRVRTARRPYGRQEKDPQHRGKHLRHRQPQLLPPARLQ